MRAAYERSPHFRYGSTADQALSEAIASRKRPAKWDVFLSHSALDKVEVMGARQKLIEGGKSVYVDWIDDPQLDRSNVTPATANVLRERMRVCTSMVYALSPNAFGSRWMPWELGYFDGLHKEQIAIMPIVDYQSDFKGEEFLGLYPRLEKDNDATGHTRTYVFKPGRKEWMTFEDFAAGGQRFLPM